MANTHILRRIEPLLLRTSSLALALSLSVASLPEVASAQDAPRAPRTASSGVTAPIPPGVVEPVRDLALTLVPPRVSDGRWRGGILFDEGFRAAIRLEAIEDQEIARHISDVLLVSTVLYAATDALATPLAQGDGGLALSASFAHVLALGVTMSAGEIVKRAAGRARPFERDCAEDPTRTGCDDGDIYSSFYSLHSGVAFTSAGFMCATHGVRGMYGDTAADAAACGISLATAATTGLLRVLSDRHYLSDVLVGATLGFLVGFLIPLAIVPDVEHDGAAAGNPVTPHALEGPPAMPIGVSFSGTF